MPNHQPAGSRDHTIVSEADRPESRYSGANDLGQIRYARFSKNILAFGSCLGLRYKYFHSVEKLGN